MARLGRGQPGYRSGHSRLRPPTVVGEAVQAAPFYGPGVKLVPVEDQRGHSRRAPKSVLNPPATLEAAPAVVYPGPQTYLTEPHRPAVTRSALQVPSAVEAAAVVISQGPRVKLVPAEDQRGHSRRAPKSVLQPPAPLEEVVVAAVYPGPRVELAKTSPQADPRRKTEYDVAAPIVVTPNDALGWIGIQLADSRNARSDGRRAPHSELRPPTTLAAAAAPFVADPLRVARAEPRRQPATRPELRAPAVVDPAVTYRPVDVHLAEPHRPAPTHSKLRPAAVVDPAVISRPLEVALTEPHRPAATRPELRAPAVVDPAVTYRPVDVHLTEPHRPAPTHSRLRPAAVVGVAEVVTYRPVAVILAEPHRPAATHPELRPPAVVGVAEVVVYEPVDVRLERSRDARPVGHTELAAPAVVGPAAIYRPVQVSLAEARKPVLGRWELRPPTVLAPPLGTPVETTLDIHLAPSGDPRRHFSKPELRAPTVVGPAAIYRPVDTELAPHPRQARAPHSELRAPAVVAPRFLAEAIQVTSAPGRQIVLRRPARSLYVEFVTYRPVETVPRVTLTAHPQRREYRSFRTPIFGILEVISPVLGHFDEPTPAGAFLDEPTLGAAAFDRSGPSAAHFDEPTPAAGQLDEPTPSAGHFDEPTPT